MRDPLTAPLGDADRALVEYAHLLTLRPGEVADEDVDALRTHGFDDRAIHDATQVISLFAYYNRLAEGLGVRKDDEE